MLFAAAAAAALRIFLPSFFDTGLTLGRSLMAVFCDTSDGADKCVDVDGVDVYVVEVVPKLLCDWLGTGNVDNINALLSIVASGFRVPMITKQMEWI